ncbi:helix-turn-helix transcriptional regulator [Spirillospora sp. NPDC047279]|uniref:helix-turn-helix domain-containing protein n=1 Tax=Spirillospora sp. NPDC047279 TaxID=3155478 RepID=UPI0033EF5217
MRTQPSTARLRRIGRVLRELREERGHSLLAAGRHLERSASSLSLIESGKQWLRARDLNYIFEHYDVEPALRRDLLTLSAQEHTRGWWDGFRKDVSAEAIDHASLEYASSAMDFFETHHIPGLLQTEDYARGVIASGSTDPRMGARFLAFRMARQQVLTKPHPARLRIVLEESILHRIHGGAAVIRPQCRRLLEVSELPHVIVQILPLACAVDPMINGPFAALTVGDPALLRLVHIDSMTRRWILDDDEVVTDHQKVFDGLCTAALPPQETQKLIVRLGSEI